MQIFCDESGGADPANDVFLVAAVILPAQSASRLVKSFRKAAKLKECEIKGHSLTSHQRGVFFDLLNREIDLGSVVVSCGRRDTMGGWAMGALAERELYSHLLHEACLGLIQRGANPLTITPDGGRYKKAELNAIATKLANAVEAIGLKGVRVGFQDSASLAGLQIADVIANTMFQALGNTPAAVSANELLEPLRSSGRLMVHPVQIADHRPDWLIEIDNTEKPPEGGFLLSIGVPT